VQLQTQAKFNGAGPKLVLEQVNPPQYTLEAQHSNKPKKKEKIIPP
jgi:hypothetical protein